MLSLGEVVKGSRGHGTRCSSVSPRKMIGRPGKLISQRRLLRAGALEQDEADPRAESSPTDDWPWLKSQIETLRTLDVPAYVHSCHGDLEVSPSATYTRRAAE